MYRVKTVYGFEVEGVDLSAWRVSLGSNRPQGLWINNDSSLPDCFGIAIKKDKWEWDTKETGSGLFERYEGSEVADAIINYLNEHELPE